MKILYAIQGTGNGHLSRAKEVIPALMNRTHVDILVSGTQSEVSMPYPIKYRFKGISFVFGKNGGIDYWKTIRTNNIFRIIREIFTCKVSEYDLVINDFEPISAWACYFKRSSCVSLSHQCALLSPKSPKSKKRNSLGEFILKYYAPSIKKYGFHFMNYDKNIFPPVIRKEIRDQRIKDKKFYTVYLPAYSDKKIVTELSKVKGVKWKVFSKHCVKAYQRKNVFIKPIKKNTFERSMAWGKGVICGAGFETPAEALFLKKKLLVIPMKGQIEQSHNAESLKQLGVPVIERLSPNYLETIENWINSEDIVHLNFPDKTQYVVDRIITNHIIITELSNKILHNI